MTVDDLLSQLEHLEKTTTRLDNVLSIKGRLKRADHADIHAVFQQYLQICQEIKMRLQHDLISRAEILSGAIQEERDALRQRYKLQLLDLNNKLRAYKVISEGQRARCEEEKNRAVAIASELKQRLEEERNAASAVVAEKSQGFPWLADAWADYLHLVDLKETDFMKSKARPAKRAAQRIREIAHEKRTLGRQFRITRNLIKYYETLFPWLQEFVGEDLDDLLTQIADKGKEEDTSEDPVRFYLTAGEYANLSITERNQRVLNRYWSKKKSSWEIGRDYERYIGYLYESDGYRVYYQGIEEGLEDLGRDLIASKRRETKVIQCKYWAQHKTIHEKHICQLFGTTLKYWIEQRHALQEHEPDFLSSLTQTNQIKGVFVTSTELSRVAGEFARELGIEVKERLRLKAYPSIKCNVSRTTGEKIYHLPMDQQYDRTLVEDERNECYVETVIEAESLGFRRAYRWRGARD